MTVLDNNAEIIRVPDSITFPSLVRPNGKLRGAILQAQKNAKAVAKDSNNKFHGYNYASAEHMLVESKDALHSAGVEVHRGSYRLKELAGNVVCEMVIEVSHPESGEQESHTVDYFVIPDKGRPLDKALNSALTTSFAYFLRDLLLIPRLSKAEADELNAAGSAPEVCGRDDTGYTPPTNGKGKPDRVREQAKARNNGNDLANAIGGTPVNPDTGEVLATPERIAVLKQLITDRKYPHEAKALANKGLKSWEEASADYVEKMIAHVKGSKNAA